MPQDKIKTSQDEGSENLQTEAPIDERDEVKQAEERTRKLYKEGNTTDLKQDDKKSDA